MSGGTPDPSPLVEHLFRHRSGQIVAALVRAFGPERVDLAEDVVQEVLLRALRRWPIEGIPDRPAGWLFRAAHNLALDRLRHETMADGKRGAVRRHLALLEEAAALPEDAPLPGELRDDQLRLLFACCHPALSEPARIALTLKLVSGFGSDEIARAFLERRTTVQQRLVRAKRRLSTGDIALEVPSGDACAPRLGSVLSALYLTFNEGHSATAGDALCRHDLVAESLRLVDLLLTHDALRRPEVHAVAALFSLLAARLPARTDVEGRVLRLEEQDRSLWDRRLLARGFAHLGASAGGDTLTTWHVEAAIAACHARAASAAETPWEEILGHYDLLLRLSDTPVIRLNRAVALLHARGAEEALAELERLADEPSLARYHWLASTRAAVLERLDRPDEAAACYRDALRHAGNAPERAFLTRRLTDLKETP